MKRQKTIVQREVTYIKMKNMYYNFTNDEITEIEVLSFDGKVPSLGVNFKFIKTLEQKEITVRCKMGIEKFLKEAEEVVQLVNGKEVIDFEQ